MRTADSAESADEPLPLDDATMQARARALSSPLRLRILRLCQREARTNRELAELLGVNPGTMLHHVRTLVATGMLIAEPERTGARGAREVPYRASGLSWSTQVPGLSRTLIDTFLQQVEGVDPEEIDVTWLGLRLNGASRRELGDRLRDLAVEFKDRGPDADGDAYSMVLVVHPEQNPPADR